MTADGGLWLHWPRTTMPSTPRKLTTHQKTVLIQVLLSFPEQQVIVCYDPSAADALAYAHDFLTVFKAIGWDVNGAPSEMSNGKFEGLAFVLSGKTALPPGAEALRDVLRIYGMEIAILSDSIRDLSPTGFVLAVGPQA